MIIDASDRFNAPHKGGQKAREAQEAKREAIEKIGNQALDSLFEDMQSKIDLGTRQIFASNFAKLLKDHDLFYPRHFKLIFEDVAGSYESFRTEFARMKNPDNEKIPASKITWKNYCRLLIKKLRQQGKTLSDSYIAHKLTMGTNFHPTAKSSNEIDQVLRSFQTLSDEFDNKFGLMESYREISDFIVDCNIEDINHKIAPHDAWDMEEESVLIIHSPLSDYFSKTYLKERAFSGQRFIDLTRDELDEVAKLLKEIEEEFSNNLEDNGAEQERLYFSYMLQELKRYLDLTNYSEPHIPEPPWGEDFRYYPHCLLGVYVYPEASLEHETYVQEFLQQNSNQNGMLYPDRDKPKFEQAFDWLGYTFLLLLPDETFTKIVPAIIVVEEEGTSTAPLDEEVVVYRGNRFINTSYPHGKGAENNSLIDLLSDAERIIARLSETAPNLKNHPIISKKRNKKQKFHSVVETLCNPFNDTKT